MVQNRNLFRLTRFILLKLPALFRFFTRFRATQNRLLIVKTDAIGDYILFRNFIKELKTSVKYKDYKIDLLGNELWKDLALQYDAPFINEFIFTKPDGLYYQPGQLLKLCWLLLCNNYGMVLMPSYSRTFITDGLAGLSASKNIIGFESDHERILPKYKNKTDRFYTKLLQLPKDICFEFDRYKFFFESVLEQTITIEGPAIASARGRKKGILIFPGAGVVKRSWEAENFLALIKLIREQTDAPVYIAGGPDEVSIGITIEQNLPPGSVINVINKTKLTELVQLSADAALVIANETSAIHIASATQTPCVCILGGGHFERFAPYPLRITNRPTCVYHKMLCYYCNWNCIYQTQAHQPYPCISNVSVSDVWVATQPLLPITDTDGN